MTKLEKILILLIFSVMTWTVVEIINRSNFRDYTKLEAKINYQDSLFKDFYYSIVDTFERDYFLITLTTYNAVKGQCDNSPNITASNLKVHSKCRYIGLSRDLLETFPYGSLVQIENAGKFNGIYVVADCMNIRLFRHVDILIHNNKHSKLLNAIITRYKEDG